MAKLRPSWITVFIFCAIYLKNSVAKPATVLESGTDPLAVASLESKDQDAAASLLRDERSPGYGFGDYDDYYDGGSSRHYKNKHKHKPTYIPVAVIQGGHGCRTHGGHGGHGCGGGSYHKPIHHNGGGGGGGGSFASASAGSFGNGNLHGGSNSQAQAASLSFGPISISTAQAQSFNRGSTGYGGYGGFGDFGYDY